jgi:hypothetical protein
VVSYRAGKMEYILSGYLPDVIQDEATFPLKKVKGCCGFVIDKPLLTEVGTNIVFLTWGKMVALRFISIVI